MAVSRRWRGLDLYNGRIEILCDETLRPYDPAADVDAPVQEAFRDIENIEAADLPRPHSQVTFRPGAAINANTNAVFETRQLSRHFFKDTSRGQRDDSTNTDSDLQSSAREDSSSMDNDQGGESQSSQQKPTDDSRFKVEFSCSNCGDHWEAKYQAGSEVKTIDSDQTKASVAINKKGSWKAVECPTCMTVRQVAVQERTPISDSASSSNLRSMLPEKPKYRFVWGSIGVIAIFVWLPVLIIGGELLALLLVTVPLGAIALVVSRFID